MTRLDDHIARLKARGYQWPLAWGAVEALARSEDCRTGAYRDIAGVWTIAWGETEGVTADMRWTEDQCDARFYQQVVRYTAKVEAMLEKPANENQLGAMVRFAYNIGLGSPTSTKRGFYWSSVRRNHNAGDFDAAANSFRLQNKARIDGVLTVSRGLTARRAVEAAMYLTQIEGAPRDPMPQLVEPESGMTSSPINRSAATVAAGGVAMATQALEQGKAVADQVAEFVGLPVPALIAAVVVIAALVIVNQRKKQRDGGWA